MSARRFYQFEGLSQPVVLTDGADLLGLLPRVMQGWQVAQAASGPDAPPEPGPLKINKRAKMWRCRAADTGEDVAFPDAVAAACWLAANVVRRQTLDNPEQLCLHAASVEIGGGLVVMPSRFRAGKSVLTATLTAMGKRVFGDDVLPIDPATGDGVASGIAPRLRLPLPENFASETRQFIDRREGPKGARYLYLDLPRTLLAPRGTRLPIRGIALLDRVEDGPAALARAPEGDALKQVIWQNFGREGDAAAILDRFAGIAARAPCVTLRYARPEDGARALIEAFEAPSLDHIPEAPFLLDAERKARENIAALSDLNPRHLLSRVDGCDLQTRAGRHFLIGAEGLTIMALNDLSAALWRLMETPLTYGEVLEVVAAAFQDEDEARIDADLRALVAAFRRNGVATVSP